MRINHFEMDQTAAKAESEIVFRMILCVNLNRMRFHTLGRTVTFALFECVS